MIGNELLAEEVNSRTVYICGISYGGKIEIAGIRDSIASCGEHSWKSNVIVLDYGHQVSVILFRDSDS